MTFDGVSPMADLRRRNGREKPLKAIGGSAFGDKEMTPEDIDSENPSKKTAKEDTFMDFYEAAAARSSVRDFTDEKLDVKLEEKIHWQRF